MTRMSIFLLVLCSGGGGLFISQVGITLQLPALVTIIGCISFGATLGVMWPTDW